jgi:hypothetical protein
MSIACVVYSAECKDSQWSSALGAYEDRYYMGEREWEIGDRYNKYGLEGTVAAIVQNEDDNSVSIWIQEPNQVGITEAMTLPAHAVQRLYYGDEYNGK